MKEQGKNMGKQAEDSDDSVTVVAAEIKNR